VGGGRGGGGWGWGVGWFGEGGHKNLNNLLFINIFPRVQKRYLFFDLSTLTKTKT
jgi:hypothetical protein